MMSSRDWQGAFLRSFPSIVEEIENSSICCVVSLDSLSAVTLHSAGGCRSPRRPITYGGKRTL